MSVWEAVKDPSEYYRKKKAESFKTATEVAEAHAITVAEIRAARDAMDMASTHWVSAASITGSGAYTTATGTSTEPTLAGFNTTELINLRHVLNMNELEINDLREIVDTYCRVKRRVDK